MPEPGGLLVFSLLLCAAGALAMCLAWLRPLFAALVAVQSIAALGAAAAVLAGGTAIELPLWQFSSFGRLVLILDPIAALMLAVTSLVFLIGVRFAAAQATRPEAPHPHAFPALYQLLFGAIVLALCAGDVLSFLISWELMSLLIYALVTFEHELDGRGRAGYVMLAMSEAGAIAGLIGLLLLAVAAGGIEFATLRRVAGLNADLRWAVFLLTFFGFGVKAGLLPVNQWLPEAYVACAPLVQRVVRRDQRARGRRDRPADHPRPRGQKQDGVHRHAFL